ncbi:MAG: hypothetical protein K2O01_06960, partial [Bacteroidales bacterium]|nr:hypothetical protein [Bacteroidales bacterium]
KSSYTTRNGLLAMFMFLTFCFSITDRNLDFKIGIIYFWLLYGLFVAYSQYTKDRRNEDAERNPIGLQGNAD